MAQWVKNLPAMQETRVLSLGREDPPGGGNGNPLQYSCLENPMDRGAWQEEGVRSNSPLPARAIGGMRVPSLKSGVEKKNRLGLMGWTGF